MSSPLVTICITTYNRPKVTCDLLKRLFFCEEVEYILVDDGSTADNYEAIETFIKDHNIPVQLYSKENGGKLSALRFGLDYAKGKYFTDLDSDDFMSNENIQNIIHGIQRVELLRRNGEKVVGVCGLSENVNGEIVGDEFPPTLEIDTYCNMRFSYKLTGNKVEVVLTQKLKSLSIEFYSGEKRMPTNVQWLSLRSNKLLFTNKRFDVYCPGRADGISANLRELTIQSKNSSRAMYKLLLKQRRYYNSRFRYFHSVCNYLRFSFHGASPFIEKDLGFKRHLALFGLLPISLSLYGWDLLCLSTKKLKRRLFPVTKAHLQNQ